MNIDKNGVNRKSPIYQYLMITRVFKHVIIGQFTVIVHDKYVINDNSLLISLFMLIFVDYN